MNGADNNKSRTNIRSSITTTATAVVCCGCRPKARERGNQHRKYKKESKDKGWLRVFHNRRYKDASIGMDSQWTAFHQSQKSASVVTKSDDWINDSDNNNDDDAHSLFFFDAVDRPLGDDEFPIDGYAIGGPNAKVVFTTTMQHPAPTVSLDDPTTLLRPSIQKDLLAAKQRKERQQQGAINKISSSEATTVSITMIENSSEEGPTNDRSMNRMSIKDHQKPSARFQNIRKRTTEEITKELKSPITKVDSVNGQSGTGGSAIEDAIGLAGYPGMLTVVELEECQKFLKGLKDLPPAISEQVYSFRDIEEEPYTICRWLRATKFNAEEILQRLQENQPMFEEAKRNNFYGPDIENFLGCPLSVFLSQYPFLPVGRGKNGSPVNYFLAGKINPEGILCLTTIKRLSSYYWYAFMYKMKDEIRESQKADPDFCRCEGINVIDLTGLSASALSSDTMEVIKISSKISDLFPETLHCMLIINSPSFFAFSWKIIKNFIDARTASRIQLFSSKKDGQLALEKMIDKKNDIPGDYGGGNISLNDAFLKEVSDPLVIKQEVELLYIKRKKGKVQLSNSWTLDPNQTMDISVYSRSVSAAEITILLEGESIHTGQLQCRFGSSDDEKDDNDGNEKQPYPNRSKLIDSSKEIKLAGPGKVMITATDLDSSIAREKQYSSSSRGYFLVVGDIKDIDKVKQATSIHKSGAGSKSTAKEKNGKEKHVSFNATSAHVTMAGLSDEKQSSVTNNDSVSSNEVDC